MPRENVELRITARDRATRAIEQIEGRLEGLDEAARFDIDVTNLSELRSDLDRIEEQARGIRADVDTTQAERSIRELSGQLEQGMRAEVDLDITQALRQVSRLETALERAVRQRAVITGLTGLVQADAPQAQPVAVAPAPQPPTLSVAARLSQQPTRFPTAPPTTAAGGRIARRQQRLAQADAPQAQEEGVGFVEALGLAQQLNVPFIEAATAGDPFLQQQPLTQFIRRFQALEGIAGPRLEQQPLAQAGVISDVEGFTEEDLAQAELVGAEPISIGTATGLLSAARAIRSFFTGARQVGRSQAARAAQQSARAAGRPDPGAGPELSIFEREVVERGLGPIQRFFARRGVYAPREAVAPPPAGAFRRLGERIGVVRPRQGTPGVERRGGIGGFFQGLAAERGLLPQAPVPTPLPPTFFERAAGGIGRFAGSPGGRVLGGLATAGGGAAIGLNLLQDDEDQASLGAADIETQQREFDAVVQRLGISPGIAGIIVNEIDDELNAGRATALRYATIALQSQEPALIAQATEVFEFLQARIRIQGIEEQGPDAIIDRFTQAIFEEGGLANLSNLGIPESLVAPEVIEAQARADLGLREGEEIPRTQEGFRAVLSAQARTLAELATTPQARQSVAAARPGLRTATDQLRDDFRRLTSESIFEALNNAFGRQPLPPAPAREVTPQDIGLGAGQRLLEQEALVQQGEQAVARAETAAQEFPQVGAFLPGQQARFQAIRDRFEGPFRQLTDDQISELFTFAPQLRADALNVIEEELTASQEEAEGGRPLAGRGRRGRGRGTFLSAANRVLSFEEFQRQIPFLPSGFAGTLAPATGDEFREQLDALGADLVDPRRQGLAPSGFAAALPGIRGPQFREQLRNLGRGTTQEPPQGFGGAFAGALGGQLSEGLFGFESLAAIATPGGVGAFLGGAIGNQLVDIGLDQLDELRARITPTLRGILLNTAEEDTSAELDLVPGLSPSSPALPQEPGAIPPELGQRVVDAEAELAEVLRQLQAQQQGTLGATPTPATPQFDPETNPFTPGPGGTGQQFQDNMAALTEAIRSLRDGQNITVVIDGDGLADMTTERTIQAFTDGGRTIPSRAVEDG